MATKLPGESKMTYDEWFQSQQGTAYNGSYSFAKAAWQHQSDRIESIEAEVKEQALQYISSFGQCQEHMERIESLEQLAKEMAEALEEQSRVTFEAQMVDFHVCCDGTEREGHTDDCAVIKALSRYREVCGGEK